MSSLTNQTLSVWRITIFDENNKIVKTDESLDYTTAVQEAYSLVSELVDLTGKHHEATVVLTIVPKYI